MTHEWETKWDTTGVLLDEPAVLSRANFGAIFGNDRPIEVEIGTGKGTFLLVRAAAREELNFLGIERAYPYCCYAADRIRRAGLSNARMLHIGAEDWFRVSVEDRSLWRVHIYFPDPWPKQRHHRRRLIQPGFITQVHRTLHLGGQLLIVTDHLDYFQSITAVLNQAGGFARMDFPKMVDHSGELVGTNFERKYIAQGRSFFKLARIRY